MKFITYRHEGRVSLGAVVGDDAASGHVVDLSGVAPNMLALIEMGEPGLARAQAEIPAAAIPLQEVELLAPILQPRRNVMCLGLNYAAHAAESQTARGQQVKVPTTPVVFTKATTAVCGPFAEIPYDAAVSTQIDWEVELAVVIGRAGKNIPAESAYDHVFGYMVLNDVSARDLQHQGKQYFKGKSLDGHCPTGPWIVTADELPDPGDLSVTCRVNGVIKQSDTTRHMIFDVPATIAYLSRGMTLLPGDIIATGTPEGVGFARTPPEFLKPGDLLESEISGIGTLRNAIGG